ncbi:hypothetical protein SAMN05216548_11341 [Faunimonas pinastri]|uniref:Uncharacterized protein n=1 Tax=Faunimonas pinastri TaxID=1855383 RepID=A0A1H9MB84_9HYPH|nr:hypothetical protein [Faunimonas pinastri]SER20892.1 hypothetical protein SAMN05216548_11341 [Faunimonas pinastri]
MSFRPLLRSSLTWPALATLLVTAGCVPNPVSPVEDARTQLIGLRQNDIRMCAGFPTKVFTEGDVDIWSYEKSQPSSAGVSVPVLPNLVGASVSLNGGGDCRLQVRFDKGRVTRIAYAGDSNAVSGRNAVCTPLIAGCVRFARGDLGQAAKTAPIHHAPPPEMPVPPAPAPITKTPEKPSAAPAEAKPQTSAAAPAPAAAAPTQSDTAGDKAPPSAASAPASAASEQATPAKIPAQTAQTP